MSCFISFESHSHIPLNLEGYNIHSFHSSSKQRHVSLSRPRLWLKEFLYQLDETLHARSPVEYKDRKQQARCLRRVSSLAAAMTDNNLSLYSPPPKKRKERKKRIKHKLPVQIKISYSLRSLACCFIHRMHWDSANSGFPRRRENLQRATCVAWKIPMLVSRQQ